MSIFLMMPKRSRLRLILFAFPFALMFHPGCAPAPTPTPFRPPTQPGPTQVLPTTTSIPQLYSPIPIPSATVTLPGPCTNNLTFIDDITIEDGILISPGFSIDKQWLVQNSGSCNWDSTYRLKWIGGDTLSAVEEQALYPARAGTQATLRIFFTAPTSGGSYESAWQAVDPNGNVFGDLIYIKIVVPP